MNTSQLECFTTLAGTLNYMRTAEELSLTQPAVSRQIQSLEAELGAKLFHRTTRSVTLTQIGAAFLPEAEAMLASYYRARQQISNFYGRAHHALRIGYADTLAARLFPRFLSPLTEKDPLLSPEFTLDQTDANLERMERGSMDLVYGIRDAKFASSAISFVPLHEEYFLCALRDDHPLAVAARKKGATSLSTADLYPYRQILDIPPYLMKHLFTRRRHILPANEGVNNCLVSNAGEAYALVLSGIGYALLPQHLVTQHDHLVFLSWQESPHTPLGIYIETAALKDTASPAAQFVENAKWYYTQMRKDVPTLP